ncbi:hypothetical protein CapIbe_016725 [Capra ibex]
MTGFTDVLKRMLNLLGLFRNEFLSGSNFRSIGIRKEGMLIPFSTTPLLPSCVKSDFRFNFPAHFHLSSAFSHLLLVFTL